MTKVKMLDDILIQLAKNLTAHEMTVEEYKRNVELNNMKLKTSIKYPDRFETIDVRIELPVTLDKTDNGIHSFEDIRSIVLEYVKSKDFNYTSTIDPNPDYQKEFEAFKEDGTKIGVFKHDDGHMIHRPEDYEKD